MQRLLYTPLPLPSCHLPACRLPAPRRSAAGFNQSWFVWQDPSDAFVTRLGKDKDLMTTRRDTSKDPKREAGLVNPQRYAFGLLQAGFPTYLGAPMAFTTDDLKAGKVDVALVGMVVDDNGGE